MLCDAVCEDEGRILDRFYSPSERIVISNVLSFLRFLLQFLDVFPVSGDRHRRDG